MTNFLLKPEEIKQLTDIKGGCLASNKITVDGEKIGYAYREQPDTDFPNDSGWRFFLLEPKTTTTLEIQIILIYLS